MHLRSLSLFLCLSVCASLCVSLVVCVCVLVLTSVTCPCLSLWLSACLSLCVCAYSCLAPSCVSGPDFSFFGSPLMVSFLSLSFSTSLSLAVLVCLYIRGYCRRVSRVLYRKSFPLKSFPHKSFLASPFLTSPLFQVLYRKSLVSSPFLSSPFLAVSASHSLALSLSLSSCVCLLVVTVVTCVGGRVLAPCPSFSAHSVCVFRSVRVFVGIVSRQLACGAPLCGAAAVCQSPWSPTASPCISSPPVSSRPYPRVSSVSMSSVSLWLIAYRTVQTHTSLYIYIHIYISPLSFWEGRDIYAASLSVPPCVIVGNWVSRDADALGNQSHLHCLLLFVRMFVRESGMCDCRWLRIAGTKSEHHYCLGCIVWNCQHLYCQNKVSVKTKCQHLFCQNKVWAPVLSEQVSTPLLSE